MRDTLAVKWDITQSPHFQTENDKSCQSKRYLAKSPVGRIEFLLLCMWSWPKCSTEYIRILYMQLVTFATDNGFGLQQGRPTSNVRVAETARDHKTVEQVAHPFLQIGFNSKTLPLSPRDIAQSLQLRKRINDQSWKRKGNHCKGPVAVGGIQLQLLCLSYSWLLRRLQHKLQW